MTAQVTTRPGLTARAAGVLHSRWAAPAATAAGAVAVLGYVGSVSPYASGNYPTCPTLALAGVYCPGCGALRALHGLANLDLAAAWGMNPLAVLAVPLLAALWFGWARRRWTGRPRTWLAPPWVLHGLLAVILLWWVLRNVPALAPWLAPGGEVAPLLLG